MIVKNINVKVCNNFFNRFKGFMFTKKINIGLCFPRCNSIHTMFMLKPIDVIMTDKNYKVLYIFFHRLVAIILHFHYMIYDLF